MRGIAGVAFQKEPIDVTIFHTIKFSVYHMLGVCMTERPSLNQGVVFLYTVGRRKGVIRGKTKRLRRRSSEVAKRCTVVPS